VTIPLTVVAGTVPGAYQCYYGSQDGRNNYSNATAFGQILNVTRNTGDWDDNPPALLGLTLSSPSVEVGTSNQTVFATVHVTDATKVENVTVACGVVRATAYWAVNPSEPLGYSYLFEQSQTGSGFTTFTGTQKDLYVTIPLTVVAGTVPGAYQCYYGSQDGRNNYSNATAVGEILKVYRTPVGLPSEPTELTFTADKPTTGVLTWSTPEVLGDPSLYAYIAQYSLDGTTWTAIANAATTSTSIPLSGLRADTDYWFRVKGENGGTVGQDTSFMNLNWATIRVHTPPPVVPDAPTGLLVTNRTSTGFQLDWTSSAYNGGSAITNFTVALSRDGGTTWMSARTAASTSTRTTVTGAAPGTEYLIHVAAVNAVGASGYLNGSVTTVNVAPYAPQNLRSTSVTSTSLTLLWDLPSSNGGTGITDYKVEFSSNGGTTWNVITHDPSAVRSFNVTGLTRATAYQFRVSAKNSIGYGVASSVHSITTLADVPGAPTLLTKASITSSGIKLGWAAPTNNGGAALTDYKVEVSRDSGATWSTIPRAASTSRKLRISGMAPGTTYQVRVSAKNSAGFSSFLTVRL
jgi:hypothetical protein